VNLKLITLDARGQSPWLQALMDEKCVPAGTRLKGERNRDETGIQIEAGQERTPRNINAGIDFYVGYLGK
jgi:hypothetical protein